MGCRIHVIKKKREYGETGALNYGMETFVNLLTTLGCDVCQKEEDYTFCEVELQEYKSAIEVFKRYIEHVAEKHDKVAFISSLREAEGVIGGDTIEYITNSVDEFFDEMQTTLADFGADDYTPNYILKVMQVFLEERDKNWDWIQFEMF